MDKRQADSPLAVRSVWLSEYRFGLRLTEQGSILSVGDGIAWIKGLPSAAMDETLLLEDGSRALVFYLAKEALGAILLQQSDTLTAGMAASLSGRRLSIPVGDPLLGRVINPLGNPLDGGPEPECRSRRDLDIPSPSIVARDFVKEPLYTQEQR